MNDSKLCENIRHNLEVRGIHIPETSAQDLYASILACMSEILSQGDIIDISDFGSFWKKENGALSSVFFRPHEDILTRINPQE
jgi:nucleoid DNA-binding protein